MLNLRIIRGPLKPQEDEAIVREYNRLTSSQVTIEEYRRWMHLGPAGPAWHALLETDDARIVGHASNIPFFAQFRGSAYRVGKGEYLFVQEDFRREKVRGFGNQFTSPGILLLDELYRHCRDEGWGPFLISAPENLHPVMCRIGCQRADLPLRECLFVLRPLHASRSTPNLTRKQRMALFLAGAAQRSFWSGAQLLLRRSIAANAVPLQENRASPESGKALLFEDQDSFCWRYPEQDYLRLKPSPAVAEYLVAKRSAGRGYLRVCQWNLSSAQSVKATLLALIRIAMTEKRSGVRWAVYEDGGYSQPLIAAMHEFGFLCAPRVRTLFFYPAGSRSLAPETWKINDSLLTFDY